MIVTWLNELPERSRILSAGAGTGAEVITLGMRYLSWRFVAADISRDMLTACHTRIQDTAELVDRVEYFNGSPQDYRDPAPFDAATSIFVSHFMHSKDERRAYFRAIAERLKPGGLFVLADLYGDRRSEEFGRLLNAWLTEYTAHGVSAEELSEDRERIDRDIAFIPEDELLSLLTEVGFSAPLKFYQSFLFGAWITAKQNALKTP